MSRSTRLGLVALLLLGAACQPAQKTETATLGAEIPAATVAPLSSEDEAAIRAIDAEWGRAATAGEADAIAALYTSDAVVLPPMQPALEGAAAKKHWADFVSGFSGPTKLTTTAVEGSGDLAIAVGTYRSTLTPKKAGGKPIENEGKYLEVLKKQADGSWKIAYDIWNDSRPAAKQ